MCTRNIAEIIACKHLTAVTQNTQNKTREREKKMQKLKQCKTVIYVHIKRYDPGWKTFNENAHTKLAHVGFDFSSFQKNTQQL